MDIMDRIASALRRRTRQHSITSNGKKIEIVKYHDGTQEVLYNGVVYSRMRPNSLLTNSYWDYFLPLAYLYENPKILMIGLGGGTIAYQFENSGAKISEFDIVEIDKDMISIAKAFYPRMRAKIIEGDGIEYVKGSGKRYDILILDAYINYSIPSAFMSRPFIESAYASLSDNGILAINYLNDGGSFNNTQGFISMLKEKFTVYTLDTDITLYNTIILASKSLDSKSISDRALARMPEAYANRNMVRSYSSMKSA